MLFDVKFVAMNGSQPLADSGWAQMWDERYREEGFAYGTEPSRYLMEQGIYLEAGKRALAVADGGGRNAVWLAERGLDVTVVDLSAEGLARAQELANQSGVQIKTMHADFLAWSGRDPFDVVVSVYLHLPPDARCAAHKRMVDTLAPGGILILEGFHKEQIHYASGGPRNVDMLFDETMLLTDFASLIIEEIRVEQVELQESRLHWGPAMLIRMRARKAAGS